MARLDIGKAMGYAMSGKSDMNKPMLRQIHKQMPMSKKAMLRHIGVKRGR